MKRYGLFSIRSQPDPINSDQGEEMDEEFREAVRFHGHSCPGIAIGYRVAKYVKNHYERSEDEELVAIVENSSCSVDAIQALLGCTFGKGNFIFQDHGKHVYTFYSRDHNKAIRIYFKNVLPRTDPAAMKRFFAGEMAPEERKKFLKLREEAINYILTAPDEDLLVVREVDIPAPPRARIHPSIECQECGEAFMEVRGRTADGKIVCEECYQRLGA